MTTDDRAGRWHRDLYAAAVWSSDLTTTQRIVALAYADHARDSDTAWVSYERLMQRTALGRTALAAAVRVLAELQWLVVVEPARQHRSARYRLTIPQSFAFRTAEPSQTVASRTTEDASSSPRDASSSPRDASSSPGGPDLSSDHKTDNTTAREEDVVLVQPEDRDPSSDENLADRLRGTGVTWNDHEITDALARLTRVFGDDAAAITPAVAVLMSLATKRPRPVERLGAYLASLTDDQLRALRPVERKHRKRIEQAAPRCDQCSIGPTPPGFIGEDSEGRYLPCPTCKPHLVRKASAA